MSEWGRGTGRRDSLPSELQRRGAFEVGRRGSGVDAAMGNK